MVAHLDTLSASEVDLVFPRAGARGIEQCHQSLRGLDHHLIVPGTNLDQLGFQRGPPRLWPLLVPLEGSRSGTADRQTGAVPTPSIPRKPTRYRLACARRELGESTQAVAELEGVLDAQSRILGADHQNTVQTRESLARWREMPAGWRQDHVE